MLSSSHVFVMHWSGFLTVDLSNRIEGLLKRLKRGAYLKQYTSFAKLSIDVSHDLFLKAQSPNHCLNHLLPVCSSLETLRSHGHNYFLLSTVLNCTSVLSLLTLSTDLFDCYFFIISFVLLR